MGLPLFFSAALPRLRRSKRVLLGLASLLLLSSCGIRPGADSQGPVEIDFWLHLTGYEAQAFQTVIEDFHATQDRIRVKLLKISRPDEKIMLAVAAGHPPDIAYCPYFSIPAYAESNALMPLDRLAAETGITRDQFTDIFWEISTHRGHLWALPVTAAINGLYWNKKVFRDAGLDPERPPRSIAELEEFNERITQVNPDGGIRVMGHCVLQPDRYQAYWLYWFGGRILDGQERIDLLQPENIAAFEWIDANAERYGPANLIAFQSGMGTYTSPEHPFFQGRLGMVLNGMWMDIFAQAYAPEGFEYGVAPFPSVDPERLPGVAVAMPDTFAIPAGAAHPQEAFEFLAYMAQPGPSEKLAMAMGKLATRRAVSKNFLENHPNPNIEMWVTLAASPNLVMKPPIASQQELEVDLNSAAGQVIRQANTPEGALADVQRRQQAVLDRKLTRWKRVAAAREKLWSEQ